MADQTTNASLAPVIDPLVSERFAIEQAQGVLLARLRNQPDDFAATTELQAMYARSASLRSQIPPLERDRLVREGLSSIDRTRMWLRSKVRRRGRDAQTIVTAAGPCPEAPTITPARRGVVSGASPAPPGHLAPAPMARELIRRGGHLYAGRGAAMTTRRVP